MNIYIGDGSKIKNRIRNQHCAGNVEGSSLRKHIALAMGFQIVKEQRENGTWATRLGLPNLNNGEQLITKYMRTGIWKFIICPPGISAKDFQFYAIQHIDPAPLLNINQGQWDVNMLKTYQILLNQLENCTAHNYNQTINIPNESGVYLFIHENEPI
jgi:hypothetical protein